MSFHSPTTEHNFHHPIASTPMNHSDILKMNRAKPRSRISSQTEGLVQTFLEMVAYIEIPWGVQKVQNSTLFRVLFRWIPNIPFLHLIPVNKDCAARKLLRGGDLREESLAQGVFN
ncbi:hypothetical protein CEXT_767251 [Caerostris extrusa]|uniref:Uncharacterized protein n=1 Tax=Caerostris extrusa TaxID=172846 RepID=A0AAV4P2X9_CAEEX|nr:hypothetical protein CEXT_767251 [Caerostris extrusa]